MTLVPVVQGGVPKLLTLSKAGTATITVPANRLYVLMWAHVLAVTSADVADRTFRLTLTMVNTYTHYLASSGTVTASTTKRMGYGLSAYVSGSDYGTQMGGLILYPGQKISTYNTNEQAGDTWSIEGLYFEVPISVP